MREISLSPLQHTWIIDIDGTILEHNGYKKRGDYLLEGVVEFWQKIPPDDVIVLMTARDKSQAPSTTLFLEKNGLRFDHVIFGVPTGERVLINDKKPSGLITAHAVNIERNRGMRDLLNVFFS